MANYIWVSLSLSDTSNLISNAVIRGSVSGTIADSYQLQTPEGRRCIVMIFEKYFIRTSNYASLSVTLDDFYQSTRVVFVASGGSGGLARFDWGAAKSFAGVVESTLAPYRIG